MSHSKRLSLMIALLLVATAALPGLALAETSTTVTGGAGSQTSTTVTGGKAPQSDPGGGVKLLNPLGGPGGAASLEELVNSVLSFVIRLGTIVVVVMMVYVGYLFVTARGNPGEISKAREALKWTVVGALILLGSQALTAGIIATVRALGGG